MSTKKELSIQDIMNSFNEMADLVLGQLSLIEKLMTINDKAEQARIDNQNKKE